MISARARKPAPARGGRPRSTAMRPNLLTDHLGSAARPRTRYPMCVETKSQSHQLRFKPTSRISNYRHATDSASHVPRRTCARRSGFRATNVRPSLSVPSDASSLTRLLKGYSNSNAACRPVCRRCGVPPASISITFDGPKREGCVPGSRARGAFPATESHTASYGLIRPHTAPHIPPACSNHVMVT
jgi:hypothetical protein